MTPLISTLLPGDDRRGGSGRRRARMARKEAQRLLEQLRAERRAELQRAAGEDRPSSAAA